ncbi:MAG: FAD-dependent oxidoreductase [Bdellovibrionales bacterium]|nr:FAD-dependent oxidoreductase [Bdellovibrionales bacterium]
MDSIVRGKPQRIAVVGSGISALTASHLLARAGHSIHLFEKESRLGGHTHTHEIQSASGRYSVDTGFIVFNDWTYPNFIKLMDSLGVQSQDSDMSFSVKVEENGLEYNGTSLNSLFAQRSNLLKPSFYGMIRDILRFNRESPQILESGHPDQSLSLKEYLQKHRYRDEFRNHYLIPMGAAIWSASKAQMEVMPIEFFVRFFKNHGMLSVDDRPVWRVIKGGSFSYLAPLSAPFRSGIKTSCEVIALRRTEESCELEFREQDVLKKESFDHVILACHSNQALAILTDPSPAETEILSAISYQANSVILHTDTSVLPDRKLAWASWNYFLPEKNTGPVAVTYIMNILQGIKAPETFCVSLNLDSRIDPSKIVKKMTYDHPVFTPEATQAQSRWSEISGRNRTHFAGAYWGFGFHEDGAKSGIRVAKSFGVEF